MFESIDSSFSLIKDDTTPLVTCMCQSAHGVALILMKIRLPLAKNFE